MGMIHVMQSLLNAQPHQESVTATDGIATFDTDFEAPIEAAIPFEPKQNLNGYDHPWTAGGSANMIPDGTDTDNGYVDNYYLSADGSNYSSVNCYISEYFQILPDTIYTFSQNTNLTKQSICFYDSEKAYISGVAAGGLSSQQITTPSNAAYARSTQIKDGRMFQLELGSTASAILPHSNICPIDGWTGCNIYDRGANINYYPGALRSDNNKYYFIFNNGTTGYAYFSIPPRTKIYVSIEIKTDKSVTWRPYYRWAGGEDTGISSNSESKTRKFTLSNTTDDFRRTRLWLYANSGNFTDVTVNTMVSLGGYADYQPYQGATLPIVFTDPSTGDPMTLYGGTVTINGDGSADVTVDHWLDTIASATKTNNYTYYRLGRTLSYTPTDHNRFNRTGIMSDKLKTLNYNPGTDPIDGVYINTSSAIIIKSNVSCSNSDELFERLGGNLKVCYGLKYPFSYHFDSVGQLKAWLGQNNLWADLDSNPTVTYWKHG